MESPPVRGWLSLKTSIFRIRPRAAAPSFTFFGRRLPISIRHESGSVSPAAFCCPVVSLEESRRRRNVDFADG